MAFATENRLGERMDFIERLGDVQKQSEARMSRTRMPSSLKATWSAACADVMFATLPDSSTAGVRGESIQRLLAGAERCPYKAGGFAWKTCTFGGAWD